MLMFYFLILSIEYKNQNLPMSNFLVFFCLLSLALSSIVGPQPDSTPLVPSDLPTTNSPSPNNQNPSPIVQTHSIFEPTVVSSSLPTEKSSSINDGVTQTSQSTQGQSVQNTKAIAPLKMIKNLLSKKYLEQLAHSKGTQQNSSIPQTMIEYQKGLIKKYQIGSNQQKNGIDNIDNGKNNTFIGKQNVVIEGGSNNIIGVSNAVNGSGNHIIDGKNNFVKGDNNVIMSGPLNLDSFKFPGLNQMQKQNLYKKRDSSINTQASVFNKTTQNLNKDNINKQNSQLEGEAQNQIQTSKTNVKQDSTIANSQSTNGEAKDQAKPSQQLVRRDGNIPKTNNLQVILEPLPGQSNTNSTKSSTSTIPSAKTQTSNSQLMSKLTMAVIFLVLLLF